MQKAEHATTPIQETTVEQVIGGMRGIRSMLWDASVLDPNEVLGSILFFFIATPSHITIGHPFPWFIYTRMSTETPHRAWWQGDFA
jgi:hypothetical protein